MAALTKTESSIYDRVRPPGSWAEKAICADFDGPDYADPPNAETAARAASSCLACPVRPECGAYGRASRGWGVWGGVWLENGKARPLPRPSRCA